MRRHSNFDFSDIAGCSRDRDSSSGRRSWSNSGIKFFLSFCDRLGCDGQPPNSKEEMAEMHVVLILQLSNDPNDPYVSYSVTICIIINIV